MSRVRTQLVIDGKNNSQKAFDEVRKDLDSLDKRIAQAGQAVVGYLSVQTLVGAIRTIAGASDAWVEMTGLGAVQQICAQLHQTGQVGLVRRTYCEEGLFHLRPPPQQTPRTQAGC